MLFEQFLNEGKRNKFYLLNSGEKIDTSNPMSNGLVSGREGSGKEEDKMTYLFVKTYKYKNPIVIAGSDKPEGYGVDTEGEKSNIALLDDINRTTSHKAHSTSSVILSGPRPCACSTRVRAPRTCSWRSSYPLCLTAMLSGLQPLRVRVSRPPCRVRLSLLCTSFLLRPSFAYCCAERG
jgi:hypothetical protein